MNKSKLETWPLAVIVVGAVLLVVLIRSFLGNLPADSGSVAAWVQAFGSIIGIGAGAFAVYWQANKARLEQSQRDARMHDALARLLIHARDAARENVIELKTKIRLDLISITDKIAPNPRFSSLASAVMNFPLESVQGELGLDALLRARGAVAGLIALTSDRADFHQAFEYDFRSFIEQLDVQVMSLRSEAERLMKGAPPRHAAAAE